VTTCAEAGFPGDVQMGSASNTGAADANLIGTVGTNSGTIQPGQGQEVNIAIRPTASVVIDAVVVKGGDGYNVYSNSTFLPPTLPPPQHYISPLTGGGNVPDISHWFVCYRLVTPPPTGSITVVKTVIGPSGILRAAPPTGYTALVTCGSQTQTVAFSAGGGEGTPSPALTNLPLNTVCTVVEQNPPPGAVVSYNPPGANTTGVTITGTTSIEVTITNDFSQDPVETGNLQLEKVVNNPAGATVPANFTAHVTCNDGVTDSDVTLPGSGGTGTPVLHPQISFDCRVEETSVPSGWSVTYSVNGGQASSTPPVVTITSTTDTITVTLTNTTAVTTTTTTVVPTTTTIAPTTTTIAPTTTTAATETASAESATSAEPTTTTSEAAQLASTGSDSMFPLGAAVSALLAGFLLLAISAWPRRKGQHFSADGRTEEPPEG
jgi:hypothetical protein